MDSVLTVFLAICCVPLVALVCYTRFRIRHRRKIAMCEKLPSALPALPVVGHLHHAIRRSNEFSLGDEQLKKLLFVPDGEDLNCVWLGPDPAVTITSPENIRTVLLSSKCAEKSEHYDCFHMLFKKSLMCAPACDWKISRKELNPVFRLRNLEHIRESVNEKSQQLVQELSHFVDKGNVDVFHLLLNFSLRNTVSLCCGEESVTVEDEQKLPKLASITKVLQEKIGSRVYLLWLRWDWLFRLYYKKYLAVWTHLITSIPVLKKTITESSFEEHLKSTGFNEGEGDRLQTISDAIRRLAALDPKFNSEYSQQEVTFLLLAGTDTTAITMASALVFLGQHPSIQDKLYEEIVNTLGENTCNMTPEEVNKLTYLDQVLKETLRMCNTIPIITRKTDKDLTINGKTIPEGTSVTVSLLGLHWDPIIYPDPLKFDPERFSQENVAKRDRHAFIPFSAGTRDCIGKHLAMLQMKLAMVHILKEFKVGCDLKIENMMFTYGLTMYSKDGYEISFTKRK